MVNKFVLNGDKFIPESHLRQLRFNYSTCGLFAKHHDRIKNSKKQ